MLYDYTPLLKTLYNKGLTKKQLREILQLSPATMARMSAGEPIATETLGRICDLLQCDLSKIFTIVPEKEPAKPWDRLSGEANEKKQQTFRIYLYFLFSPDNNEPAEYIYGYAIPFLYDETDMDIWYATYGTGEHKNFCAIDGTLFANDLLHFIDAAMNRNTIEEILKLCNVKEIKYFKEGDLLKLKQARIANGSFVYRPPYYLIPQNAVLACQEEMMPLLSYEENTTVCESLHGLNKKRYYSTENGIDTEKASLLWSYLSSNLPFHKNLNEMARLGNFEVLTPLATHNNQLVKCEVWQENCTPLVAKITISNQLTGNYILRIKFLNSSNPVLDNSYIVNPQNEEENPLYIPLNEDYTFTEIELWTTVTTHNSEQRLIYQSCTPYIREIGFTLNVLQRNLSLTDKWTQAMKQQEKMVNTHVSFFNSYPVPPITARQAEPWVTEERSIQKDFFSILGNGTRIHDYDAFFPKGTDNILEFLLWLKQRLKTLPEAQRILLFDPYVNAAAVNKFIRSIQNSGIIYEIITDSCPAGKKRDEEIANIKQLSSEIGAILPCKLTVRTITRSSGTLHDRLLIIAGKDNVIVYILSNSLDSMAKQHSSIVTAVKPAVAQKIFNEYVQLVKKAEEENKVVLLFDTKNPTLKTLTHVPITKSNDKITTLQTNNKTCYYTADNFICDYGESSTETALANLSHMRYEEKVACINHVLSLNRNDEIERLESILLKAKNFSAASIRAALIPYILNQNTLARYNFDIAGTLIDFANSGIEYYFEYRSVLPAPYANAIDILWQLSPSSYIRFLENLLAEQQETKDTNIDNVTNSSPTVLIYSLLTQIIIETTSPAMKAEELFPLGKSEIAYLRAIFTAKTLWLNVDFLITLKQQKEIDFNNLHWIIQTKCDIICSILQPEEACTALIFLIKKLQTEICRHQHVQEHTQALIDSIICIYVKTLANCKKTDASRLIQQLAPLNLRNPADICQIITLLRSTKQLSAGQSYEILIHFWKSVYIKENDMERGFFNEDSIKRSKLIANEIIKNGYNFTERLLKEITNGSRRLCARLYDPLLRSKNYTAWKTTVEQLACLFITERYIVSQNSTLSMGKGETEYQKLTENYAETLSEYSIPYQIWKQKCLQ